MSPDTTLLTVAYFIVLAVTAWLGYWVTLNQKSGGWFNHYSLEVDPTTDMAFLVLGPLTFWALIIYGAIETSSNGSYSPLVLLAVLAATLIQSAAIGAIVRYRRTVEAARVASQPRQVTYQIPDPSPPLEAREPTPEEKLEAILRHNRE